MNLGPEGVGNVLGQAKVMVTSLCFPSIQSLVPSIQSSSLCPDY